MAIGVAALASSASKKRKAKKAAKLQNQNRPWRETEPLPSSSRSSSEIVDGQAREVAQKDLPFEEPLPLYDGKGLPSYEATQYGGQAPRITEKGGL